VYNPSLRKIENFVLEYLKEKNIRAEDVGVKPLVVITDNAGFHKGLVEGVKGQRSPDWLYDAQAPLYFARMPGIDLSIVLSLPAGQGFITELEVLKHLGAKIFIGVFDGIALRVSTENLFLVESALCYDGASYRYASGRSLVNASYRIYKFLKAILEMEDLQPSDARASAIDTPFLIFENDLQVFRAHNVSLQFLLPLTVPF